MSEGPWLTIVGLGEDGPDGLGLASADALGQAEIVMGPPRHLQLARAACADAECRAWPTPFADGVEALLALRGRRVVALASGDPFWFGAGSVLAARLRPDEWRCFPGPSSFTLAASRLGWRLEQCVCLGLHATPLARIRRYASPGVRLLVLVRDGAGAREVFANLTAWGFGSSQVHVLEALGGPRERHRQATAQQVPPDGIEHPVLVAVDVAGSGRVVPLAPGLDDDGFEHDGQISKRPIRALTLAALAPRFGDHLWDLGAGSGAVAIEWLLCHASLTASAVERRSDRVERVQHNASAYGVDLDIRHGEAAAVIDGLDDPQAVFVGGGATEELLEAVWARLSPGGRMVVNAVTFESEALVGRWQARVGGDLTRIELSQPTLLGRKHAWKPSFPIVQWRVSKGSRSV